MRRTLALFVPLFALLGACAELEELSLQTGAEPEAAAETQATLAPPEAYASRADRGRMIPAIDIAAFDEGLLRQRVRYETAELPGTIVIDTANYHLYFVEENGWAIRYGVAIGREGFGWTGTGVIRRRAAWPTWTPPAEMIARDPSLERHADGMPGGPRNPLGARALYVYQGGADTLIRVHGTNSPRSIGHKASSGCFRMLNQDVIDLYNRVPQGAKIIVI
ncbi:MAG: L,D-transpeptidase [Pseudomonadota bacterium]